MGLLGGIKGAASGLARSRAQRQAPGQSKPIYRRWWALLLLAVVGFNAVSSCQRYTTPPPTAPTPEQLAEQAKAAEAEQAAKLVREESERKYREQVSRVIVAASTVKENMHNPASFDLVSAIVMDDDAVCLVYRGTNGFGGIVTSRASAMGRVVSLSAKQWNKYCAGRDGRDFADAVRRAV